MINLNILDMTSISITTSHLFVSDKYPYFGTGMHCISLSLLLSSVLPKLANNRVVEFQSRSIGKGIIRLCP